MNWDPHLEINKLVLHGKGDCSRWPSLLNHYFMIRISSRLAMRIAIRIISVDYVWLCPSLPFGFLRASVWIQEPGQRGLLT